MFLPNEIGPPYEGDMEANENWIFSSEFLRILLNDALKSQLSLRTHGKICHLLHASKLHSSVFIFQV